MPIPISQTLQLAGQQEVTPWQLPFEELAAGLEKKQKNFDDKSEAVSLLDSLIPESGVFTVEAKQGLLDDYNPKIQELQDELYATGNVSKGKITALTSAIMQDERVAAINEDVKVWTPFYQEKKKTGKLDQGVHNFYDENGMPRQAFSKTELDYQFLDYVPYMENTSEFLDKYVRANITSILEDSEIKYRTNTLTGKIEVYDEQTKTYSEDRTYERIMDVVVNTVDGRYSMGQSLWNSNNDDVLFYKAQFLDKYGREATFEDYKMDVLQPVSRFISYEKTDVTKRRNILGEGKGTGSDDEEFNVQDIWTPIEVKEGVYSEHDSKIIKAVEESTGKDFEDISINDVQNVVTTSYQKYEEHKLSIDEKIKDETNKFIGTLSDESAAIIGAIGINVTIEDGIITPDIMSTFDDLIAEGGAFDTMIKDGTIKDVNEAKVLYNDAVTRYRGFVNNNPSYNTLNQISLDYENNIKILENFKNAVFDRFGIEADEIEKKIKNATYEEKLKAVEEDYFKNRYLSTEPLFWEEFEDYYTSTSEYYTKERDDSKPAVRLEALYDPSIIIGVPEEDTQAEIEKIGPAYEQFVRNMVEEEFVNVTVGNIITDPQKQAEFEEMTKAMTDVRTYDNNSYTISNFALTDNATNTSINNLVTNVATFISKDLLSRSVDASEFRVVSTDKQLEKEQADYLFDILQGVDITSLEEGKGVKITTNINGKEEIFEWQVRYDIGRDKYMFDVRVPNLPSDDKSNKYKQAKQGLEKQSTSTDWVEIPMSDALVKKIIYDTGLDTQIKAEELKRTQQVMSDIDTKGYSSSSLFKEDNSYGATYSQNDINIVWTRNKENSLIGSVKIGDNKVPLNIEVGSEKEVALLESAFQMIVRNPYYLADPSSAGEILQTLKQDFNTPVSTEKLDDRILTDLLQTLVAYTPLDLNTETGQQYIYKTYENSVPMSSAITLTGVDDKVKIKDESFRIDPTVAPVLNQQLYMALPYLPEGTYIEITSGLRSLNEQAQLMQNPDNEAAPNSNHLYGRAIDFVVRNADGTTKDEKAMKEIANAIGAFYHNGHVHLNLR